MSFETISVTGIFFLAAGPLLMLALMGAGYLWAPVAFLQWSENFRQHGYSNRFYAHTAAVYSTHLLIPYLFANRRVKEAGLSPVISHRARAVPYALWVWSTIVPSIVISAAYVWENFVKGPIDPDFPQFVINIVAVTLILPIPVNIATMLVSIWHTNRHGNNREPESMYARAETSDLLPPNYTWTLLALFLMITVPFFSLSWVIVVPLILAMVFWRMWVNSVRRRGAGLVLRDELTESILLPSSYLRPFAYAFMWFVWHIWAYSLAGLMHMGAGWS